MFRYILLIATILFLGVISCSPEEEKFTTDINAKLRFSTDTLFFDTLFTTVGSTTKRFQVFNDNDNALDISNISLGDGTSSPYTIFINGRQDHTFDNTRLLGRDSLLVLVEVTIDPQNENMPFFVEDQINFSVNGNQQDVKLVSWGQDANFLRDSVLACNTTWTADRPYVISNSILVDTLCTLTIEAGTQIFSDNGSFIFAKGSILAQGEVDKRILFRNDRLDEAFENAPGQWGGIIFLPGSNANKFEYVDIRNAEVGLYLGTPDDNDDPDLIIGNSRIENIGGNTILPISGNLVQPGFGIIGITSDLYAYNTLVNNCAVNTVGNYAGGNYRYEHCTFANFSFDFFREEPSVVFSDNLVIGEDALLVSDLTVEISNSIIWGNLRDELTLSNGGQANFSISANNNLVRASEEILPDTDNIYNEDPRFFNPRNYEYQLDTLSPAKDVGTVSSIVKDLEGVERDSKPDIGAFERVEN